MSNLTTHDSWTKNKKIKTWMFPPHVIDFDSAKQTICVALMEYQMKLNMGNLEYNHETWVANWQDDTNIFAKPVREIDAHYSSEKVVRKRLIGAVVRKVARNNRIENWFDVIHGEFGHQLMAILKQ